MGDLTENISRHEVACKCGCGKADINPEVLGMVQDACYHFTDMLSRRVVLDINSGCRCDKHNKYVGGSKNSQHLKGNAMDIKIRGVASWKLFNYLDSKYPDSCGLGLYPGFVHVDCRPTKARW